MRRAGCPSRDGIRRACVETPGRSQRREPGEPVGHERADPSPQPWGEGNTCGARSDTWCVRAARRERGAFDLGRSRCVPMKVFMLQVGPKSRRGRPGYKARPKCLAGAQREVRDRVVARTRRESGATRVEAARGMGLGESGVAWCEGGPQEWERKGMGGLSTVLEAR